MPVRALRLLHPLAQQGPASGLKTMNAREGIKTHQARARRYPSRSR